MTQSAVGVRVVTRFPDPLMNATFPKILLFILPWWLAGCGQRSENLSAVATVIVGPEYSANKGIYVPDDTRRSLGLKVVDVDEEQLVAQLDFSLRIYAVSDGNLRASGHLTPAQAQALKPGQSLEIRARGVDPLVGTITTLRSELQKLTAGIEVLVKIPGSVGLDVGSFVTARTTLEGAGPVATVPRSAVIETTQGRFVYTESGNHFVRTPVEVGAISDTSVEITDGLYAGDRVVAEPAMSLWLTELAAIKGGHACCAIPAEG